VTRQQKVRPFVTSMGDKMDYRVALDDAGSAQAYMDRYSVGVRMLPRKKPALCTFTSSAIHS
jgi:hypothetical protein